MDNATFIFTCRGACGIPAKPKPGKGEQILVNRDEYLEGCKSRALAYVDAGDAHGGFTSMLSDLRQHPETAHHKKAELGVMFMIVPGWIDRPLAVRRWIEGFD